MKNIVIINDFAYVTGGAGKVAITSAIELSNKGENVYFFAAVGPVAEELSNSNVKVICLHQKDILNNNNRLEAIIQGLWNKKAKDELEKLLGQLNPKDTIVHFHAWSKTMSGSIFKATANMGFKIVITAHDYFSFCPNGGFYNYKKNVICNYKPLSIKCLRCNCDHRKWVHKVWRVIRQLIQERWMWNNDLSFITISDLNNNIFEKNIIHKNKQVPIYRVKNPIELGNPIGIPINKNRKYVYIGRLSEEKGVDLFCEALTQMGLPGVVLGDGYKYNELKKKYPFIEFKGWVNRLQMQKILKDVRALIFPSLWYEGAPLTIIEMKSMGIPCIVSDVSAAYEEIEDGKTGYIFKSGDIEDLKDKLFKMENADADLFASNIKKTFDRTEYEIGTHIKKIESVYLKVLRNK